MMLRKTTVAGRRAMVLLKPTMKVCAVMIVVLTVCAGCESHAQNKNAAKERWDKASAQIKLTLAEQQYEDGKIEEAAKTIKECIKSDPQIPRAHLLFGKLLWAEGDFENAAEALQLAVELDPESHEGWYLLGLAAQEQGKTQDAASYYSRAMSLKPNNVDYILAVAEMYAANDKLEEAIRLLSERTTAMPKDVSLKVAAADLMCRVGRKGGAIELYKEANLMAGDDDGIAEALGYCYLFESKWNEAVEIFSNLFERCKDEHRKRLYLRVMAVCNMNRGQYDLAVQCYSKLSVEERDNAEIWVKMGQAALGAGMPGQALACGRRALALRGGYADAIALIGCAQYTKGDFAAAVECFERIRSDKKNKGFSLLMRARCYEHLGQTSKAKWAYKKASEVSPHSELMDFLVKGREARERGILSEN